MDNPDTIKPPDTSSLQSQGRLIFQQDIAPGAITGQALVPGGNQKGDLYYSKDGVRFDRLEVGTTNQILVVTAGVPSWTNPPVPVTVPTDGWTTTTDSWTYASASTITVPTGAASKYGKGDRIKFTQTTVKYFVVVAVADTLLTIAVNTDYTVANAAISAISYSHEETPVGYPDMFNFAPALTGFSGTPTVNSAYYSVVGKKCFLFLDATGTSNATSFGFTLPIATDKLRYYAARGQNNSANSNTPRLAGFSAASTTGNFYTDFGGNIWTASGTKTIDAFSAVYSF